jgi:hypothetical protein
VNIPELSITLREEGFVYLPLADSSFVTKCNGVIKSMFPRDAAYYSTLRREKFHELVEACQTTLNREGLLVDFLIQNRANIQQLIGDDNLAFVSVMKLRAVRPNIQIAPESQDHVPLHRESFYAGSDQVAFQFNCWIPLSETATTQGMYYVPRSQVIPDSELKIIDAENCLVKVARYSSGHRIGLPYAPKQIERLPTSIPPDSLPRFQVPRGHFVLFSAMLIHGGGINNSDQIRFSVDTGAIPTRRLQENRPLFAANNSKHYLTLSEIRV